MGYFTSFFSSFVFHFTTYLTIITQSETIIFGWCCCCDSFQLCLLYIKTGRSVGRLHQLATKLSSCHCHTKWKKHLTMMKFCTKYIFKEASVIYRSEWTNFHFVHSYVFMSRFRNLIIKDFTKKIELGLWSVSNEKKLQNCLLYVVIWIFLISE